MRRSRAKLRFDFILGLPFNLHVNASKFVVYQLSYKPTGQYYVGSTANLEKRRKRHFYEMRNRRHHNARIMELIGSGFSECDWDFEVISSHPDEESARQAEEEKLRAHRRCRLCLNVGRHATGGDNLTRHPDKDRIVACRKERQLEVIAKMSVAEKRVKWGKLGKDNPMYGRKHSEHAKAVMSRASLGHSRNKGLKRTQETCEKLSRIASLKVGAKNAFYGKKHSVATKAKLAEANKGRKPANMRPIKVGGVYYEGVTAAARALEVSPALVVYRLKSKKWDYHYLINA
ncbi:MAG: hypothetical protein E6R03_04585 [Hyphomicrobiaceae bacterium]|nr:MAG: hypothetical protein E6R03_04585 [Hyphomicrobiaceae bacterium]